jgi:hypothetical protein
MSKTNHTSKLGHTTKHHDALEDTELNAVTGGMSYLVTFQKSSSPEVFRDHSSPSQYFVLPGS